MHFSVRYHLYQGKFAEIARATLDASNCEWTTTPLLSDYQRPLLAVGNEAHSETVFDVEYSGLEGGGYGCLVCLEGNAAPGFHGIRQYDGPVYGDGNSYNLPTQNLIRRILLLAIFVRRDATILDLDAFHMRPSNSDSETITYAVGGGGGHTGYYNNKYIKRQGEIGLPDNDLTSPVNYRVIRYADVLLMAAEAHKRIMALMAKLLQYVNEVRARVGLGGLEQFWRCQLYPGDMATNARLELAGEGHRFFDLVRTGKAAGSIEGFMESKNELFPIPQVEIDLAGGNWSQNSNY